LLLVLTAETHNVGDVHNYDDDDAYDELIDISKPTKAGKQSRRLVPSFCGILLQR